MIGSRPPLTAWLANPSATDWFLAIAISFCIALGVVAPFFWLGTASGHDVAFHMASWLDAAGQWKEGVVLPRWTEWANFGFGEPRFIFYPPLSWLFGALLGSFLPWTSVALVFSLCAQTIAGVSAYALLRRIVESRYASLTGAACYAANPYALLIIYMRSDFAELLAIACFPLLLLAALRLTGLLAGELQSGSFGRLFLFACAFGAVWLSNAPAAVIATYSVALLFMFAAIRRRSVQPLVNGALGLAMGFCLAAFYLIPAIYEQCWVNISGALLGGLRPSDNFLFAHTGDAEHDAFNHIASKLAVLLMVWLVLAVVAALRFRLSTEQRPGMSWSLVALAGASVLLMLPVTGICWNLLPELRFVQFPWRWSSMLALCAVTLTAISLRGKLSWIWPIAATITLAGCGTYLVKHAWWDTEDMPTLQAAVQSGAGFEGTDEYDPLADDHSALPQKQSRAEMIPWPSDPELPRQADITIEQWNAEHRRIRVATRRPGRVALRLLDYPAWRVTVNGRSARLLHAKSTGQMIVPVAEGSSEIQLDFARTIDRTVGGGISVVALFSSAVVLIFRRKSARV